MNHGSFSQRFPPHHSALCRISRPQADEVRGNSSSPAPVLPDSTLAVPAQVTATVCFSHEIAPDPRGGD